ncbi:MRPL51 [Cordylochernes scorpioides]|uniref:Large ribosomal subunit protein mL51 n=1 Tax=Cordylochernes scorpioides TaxID=51811 RepID=A0ABY6KIX8_9ARAC|nr:MRPL51 [Cordylochernes scorpioides]
MSGLTQRLLPLTQNTLQLVPRRFRHIKDPYVYRWGYKPPLPKYGRFMPRISEKLYEREPDLKGSVKLRYKPTNVWSKERALFGQNDYIDILGPNPSIEPIDLQEHIPTWLRGFRGSELQMLTRRRDMFGEELAEKRPMRYQQIANQIKHLYKYLNGRVPTWNDR